MLRAFRRLLVGLALAGLLTAPLGAGASLNLRAKCQNNSHQGSLCSPVPALIKSIQSGVVTIASGAATGTATLSTAVDTTKAMLLFGGSNSDDSSASDYANVGARITLTSSTVVTATRGASGAVVTSVAFTVVEFASGVNSLQYGTITLAAAATNTATISSVGANAFVIWLGVSTTTGATAIHTVSVGVGLTNSTTVTATAGTAVTAVLSFVVADLDSSIVQSVQPEAHTDATSASTYTDTITSVTPGNTLLIFGGQNWGSGSSDSTGTVLHTIVLSNATTVTMTRSSTTATSRTIFYTVVQFRGSVLNGAVQRGTIVLSSQTSNTAVLSAVTLAKSLVNYVGIRRATSNPNTTFTTLTLTNTTTVTAAVVSAGSPTVSYEALQWN